MNTQKLMQNGGRIRMPNFQYLNTTAGSFNSVTPQIRMDHNDFRFPHRSQLQMHDFQKPVSFMSTPEQLPIIDSSNIRQTFDFNSENSDEEMKISICDEMFNKPYPTMMKSYDQQFGIPTFSDNHGMRSQFYGHTNVHQYRNTDYKIENLVGKFNLSSSNKYKNISDN